jgi:Holliday junction DNA helicase RuvB
VCAIVGAMKLTKPGITSVDDLQFDRSLRPRSLKFFTGQKKICENLEIFIKAALLRKEAIDHILISGPPGLGKTTLAQIIANEMETNIKITAGPIITKTGDLAALLTNMNERDVLFIDEIHRMNSSIEEVLYSAMEDFKIDIMIGEGQSSKAIRLDIPQFTLIGATTRLGLLSQPLRERFGIQFRFNFYEIDELSIILTRNSQILKININNEAITEIAKRARGTPRIASRLLRRIRDFADVIKPDIVNKGFVIESLNCLNVNPIGLDSDDKKYLGIIKNLFCGGPVGIETIAASMSESANTIEEVIEPYLLQQGLIKKTPRGRVLTNKGLGFAD